jgi:hypothetical protein
VSVERIRAGGGFCFRYRCNASCARSEIGLVLPQGWEALQVAGGALVHRCWDCAFWNLVEPLELDLEWRDAA